LYLVYGPKIPQSCPGYGVIKGIGVIEKYTIVIIILSIIIIIIFVY